MLQRVIINIKGLVLFVAALFQQRHIVRELVRRDFQNKYLASYLGLPWAFIVPGMSIFVMWFALTYGLRVGPTADGLHYGVWFICGIIPWLFISEAISSSVGSLLEYGFLIRKTSFRVSIIPLIKILTAFVIHLVFVGVLVGVCIAYDFKPSIYWLQILYLMAATLVLLLGITWLVSALNVFTRDAGQVVYVVLPILTWLTPIMWPYSILQGNMRFMVLLNPFFYITEGYRSILLYNQSVFANPELTLFFWGVTLAFFVTGAWVFKKLSPHFADVVK